MLTSNKHAAAQLREPQQNLEEPDETFSPAAVTDRSSSETEVEGQRAHKLL